MAKTAPLGCVVAATGHGRRGGIALKLRFRSPNNWPLAATVMLWLTLGCPILLCGCIGSPTAPKSEQETAKKFAVTPGKSSIYIYRDTMVAAIQTFRLYLDGNLVGDSKNRSFFLRVVEPGSHSIVVTNVRNQRLDDLDLDTEADKTYYVELRIKPNPVSGIPVLAIAKEKEAQTTIRECDMLQAGTDALSP